MSANSYEPSLITSCEPTFEPSLFVDANITDSGSDTGSSTGSATLAAFPFYINLGIILLALFGCVGLGLLLAYIQTRRQVQNEKYDFGTIHKNLLNDGKDVTRYA